VGGAGLAAGYLVTHRPRRYDLEGRTVLITGGSRGLGLVLVREVARAGARVAICGREPATPATLARAREDLERRGARGLAVACDVTVRGDVEDLVHEVGERMGPIDVLLNETSGFS
jgi:NAD(P)-dependent dehydrogenase (short-subunit alcohol dehydrogenase family)